MRLILETWRYIYMFGLTRRNASGKVRSQVITETRASHWVNLFKGKQIFLMKIRAWVLYFELLWTICIKHLVKLTVDPPAHLYVICIFQNMFGYFCHFRVLQWRHNERDGVSNGRPHDCLPNRLFRRRTKKTSKLRITGPFLGEFTSDRWILRTKGQ